MDSSVMGGGAPAVPPSQPGNPGTSVTLAPPAPIGRNNEEQPKQGALGHFLRFEPPPPLSSLENTAPRQSYGSQRPSALGSQQHGHSAAQRAREIKMETVDERLDEDFGPSAIQPI